MPIGMRVQVGNEDKGITTRPRVLTDKNTDESRASVWTQRDGRGNYRDGGSDLQSLT